MDASAFRAYLNSIQYLCLWQDQTVDNQNLLGGLQFDASLAGSLEQFLLVDGRLLFLLQR